MELGDKRGRETGKKLEEREKKIDLMKTHTHV